MHSELICFEQSCRARYPITEVIYNCPKCGGLLEIKLGCDHLAVGALKHNWGGRRMSHDILHQSGVWPSRELLPFDEHAHRAVSLREGNTPLLDAPLAAEYGGVHRP